MLFSKVHSSLVSRETGHLSVRRQIRGAEVLRKTVSSVVVITVAFGLVFRFVTNLQEGIKRKIKQGVPDTIATSDVLI
jgi:hypothetical protein